MTIQEFADIVYNYHGSDIEQKFKDRFTGRPLSTKITLREGVTVLDEVLLGGGKPIRPSSDGIIGSVKSSEEGHFNISPLSRKMNVGNGPDNDEGELRMPGG